MSRLNATRVWKNALEVLLAAGRPVSPLSPGAAWRGRANRELPAFQTVMDMRMPVVLSPARKMGFRFLAAEAAWICSGDNRVSTIAPYAKKITGMSDDGRRFFGAYGPKFVDQLSFVVETLLRDPSSRQAVIQIWREQPRATKDTPCTLSWQFLIRDGALHCVATMRSSDIVMGWCYDIFNFSMISAVVALELRNSSTQVLMPGDVVETVQLFTHLQLGNLYLTAGSQHLYDVDEEMARVALAEPYEDTSVLPLELSEFDDADDLIAHLWSFARRDGTVRHNFLTELYRA